MGMYCLLYSVNKQQAERLREIVNDEEFFQELERAPRLELGKEWHGLHYLLAGSSWGIAGSAGFLVEGGGEVGPADGYGPARLFSPREVDDIHSMLVDLTDEELWNRFDADQMNAEPVYPAADWRDEPEETERIYRNSFRELQRFVDEASRRGQLLLVAIN